jgi:hypothetical protein
MGQVRESGGREERGTGRVWCVRKFEILSFVIRGGMSGLFRKVDALVFGDIGV